jgi:predicted esterase
MDALERPVFLLHGIDDPVIPATESEHLAAELGDRATLLVSRALRHAESAKEASLADKLALLRFMTLYLTSL